MLKDNFEEFETTVSTNTIEDHLQQKDGGRFFCMYTSVLLPAFFSNADTLYKRENNRPDFLDGICCCSILLLFSMQKMPSSTWNNLLLWRYCHKCAAPSVPSQKRRNNFSNNVIGVDRGKLMRLLSFARRWQIQGVCVKYNCGCFFGTPCETMALPFHVT